MVLKEFIKRAAGSVPDTPEWVIKTPTWALLTILTTAVSVMIVLFLIDYIFNQVIFTLAVVESSNAVPTIAQDEPYVDSVEDESKHSSANKSVSQPIAELTTFSNQTLTSSFRRTLSHLRRIGGVRNGLFRGMGHFLFLTVLQILLTSLFPEIISPIVSPVIASILLSLPNAAVTHAIVSVVPKGFSARFPSRAAWKHLLLPNLIEGLASQAVIIVPVAFAFVLGIQNFEIPRSSSDVVDDDDTEAYRAMCKAFGLLTMKMIVVLLLALLTTIFVWLPAAIARARVEVSLLRAEEGTIVPVYAATGSRQLPDGSPAPLAFVDAWRSCDCATLRRVFCVVAKIWAISFSLLSAGLMIIVAVAGVALKDQLPGIIAVAKLQLANMQ